MLNKGSAPGLCRWEIQACLYMLKSKAFTKYGPLLCFFCANWRCLPAGIANHKFPRTYHTEVSGIIDQNWSPVVLPHKRCQRHDLQVISSMAILDHWISCPRVGSSLTQQCDWWILHLDGYFLPSRCFSFDNLSFNGDRHRLHCRGVKELGCGPAWEICGGSGDSDMYISWPIIVSWASWRLMVMILIMRFECWIFSLTRQCSLRNSICPASDGSSKLRAFDNMIRSNFAYVGAVTRYS